MRLFEHPDFDQAILQAAEYFRGQGLRAAIIEKDYFVTEALRIIAQTTEYLAALLPDQQLNFRALDMRSDDYPSPNGAIVESNPALGLHGTRHLLASPSLLSAELNAIQILTEEGGRIALSFPFVTDAREFREVVAKVDAHHGDRWRAPLGAFVETPAAAAEVHEIMIAGARLISVGTKDLCQLTLGVDRENFRVSHLYNMGHPSVIQQIAYVQETAAVFGAFPYVFMAANEFLHASSALPDSTRLSLCFGDWKMLQDKSELTTETT